MGTTTTTFALNKPTVGGDDGTWGTDWNTNADKLDDLLDGTTAIKPNLSEGLWKVGGVAVTASAAELNILDGVTGSVTAAEISYLDGVTDFIQTQLNARQPLDSQLTALAALSTSGILSTNGTSVFARTLIAGTGITISNADGGTGNPNIAASVASQAQAEAGTDNITLMTPLRSSQAIAALGGAATLLGTLTTTSGTTQTLSGLVLTSYKFLVVFVNGVSGNVATSSILLNGIPFAVITSGNVAHTGSGGGIIDLSSGIFWSSSANSAGTAASSGGASGLSTASTSISFTLTGGGTFDAGSVRIYGVK